MKHGSPHRHGVRYPLRFLAFIAIAASAACSDHTPVSQTERLSSFIEQLQRSPPASVADAEKMLRVRLKLVVDGPHIRAYEANDVTIFGIPADYIEYRISLANGNPTMFLVKIQDVCLGGAEILSTYGPMSIVAHPSPHALYSEVKYGRDEEWGRMSFGFDQIRPDCLRSVTTFVNR